MNKTGFSLIFLLALCAFTCNKKKTNQEENGNFSISITDTVNSIDSEFGIPELTIVASPDITGKITLPSDEKVMDYEVSPDGKNVAILIGKGSKSLIRFWQPGQTEIAQVYSLPDSLTGECIAWHPLGQSLFVSGNNISEYRILRIHKNNDQWTNRCIFRSSKAITKLLACPRPFITGYNRSGKNFYAYRLFFGMDNGDNSYRIVSITESGNRFYQVVGPSKTFTSAEPLESDMPPSEIKASWALPVAFHPAGHQLIWQDKNNVFYVADYASRVWGESKPMKIENCSSIIPTPNGIALMLWDDKKPGISIYSLPEQINKQQLTNFQFFSAPSFVPDGKGIIGLTKNNESFTINYLPLQLPLADVHNAWMYIKSKEELDLFGTNYGLFRPNKGDQLYQLYETENYYCNNYDRTSPTRPYLVTTDIFWELFASAYEGLFILKEHNEAIPAFWNFIEKAGIYFKSGNSKWKDVFAVLQELKSNPNSANPEVKKILKTSFDDSEITKTGYAFSECKPRGHYTSSIEMKTYFMAFKYFTTILTAEDAIKELNALPTDITQFAETWIKSYSGFIAPSRSPVFWKNLQRPVPSYCRFKKNGLTLFPLSWGFDNEVLFSTVYHEGLPENITVEGPGGSRMLPSGLDLSSVFGNEFAEHLLEPEYIKYPPLRNVINNLRNNYKSNSDKEDFTENIYNRWLNAMAVQWIDTVSSTNGDKDNNLWQTKRIQTGLATWATLRHATVLVNERGVAECGEGGFEEILMRAPRGYVEPDPYTFGAIAALFDKAVNYVPKSTESLANFDESTENGNKSLYDGIVKRLNEAADEARKFQAMAEKERKGIELTNEENEKILYVARVAEHLFLIFNSISSKDFALSNPDPMPKIADVFGDGNISPFLMVAVGNPMEWNHIVPFYGRHQIVKGSVYSYYEFTSGQLLNDEEWRKKVEKQEFPFWIKPFITNCTAGQMATTGY